MVFYGKRKYCCCYHELIKPVFFCVIITGVEGGGGKDLVVDEKELVLDGGFLVPHTNSFGQTFRLWSLHSVVFGS